MMHSDNEPAAAVGRQPFPEAMEHALDAAKQWKVQLDTPFVTQRTLVGPVAFLFRQNGHGGSVSFALACKYRLPE